MRRESIGGKRACGALGIVACLLACSGAGAFSFSDGKSESCFAAGKIVKEVDAPEQAAGFTGKAIPTGSGYVIAWNRVRLAELPPEMHDFIFFHECAHARVPTVDELEANCAGLRHMREAGRAGPAVEAKLGAFYGTDNDYWARTLKCADGQTVAPAKP